MEKSKKVTISNLPAGRQGSRPVLTIKYDGELRIIDQRALPERLKFKKCNTLKEIYSSIKTLAVRGAPAIGVFAAYGLCVCLRKVKTKDKDIFFKELLNLSNYLKTSRPTAVNLFWALERMEETAFKNREKSIDKIKEQLESEAKRIQKEDKLMCENIGRHGAKLIRKNDTILTHCNAGALATAGEGTALSVIYKAKRDGKRIKVYADETRPLLQGSRLTAWELKERGVDVTLICDNMAATLMAQGKVDKIIVGADRIAKNGDFANKIGTYSLAVLAKEHKIPFYVAAPSSTFDFSLRTGKDIPIEKRSADEIRRIKGKLIAPKDIKVYNPAFDVTPNRLVGAIITEKGIFKKPFNRTLKRI